MLAGCCLAGLSKCLVLRSACILCPHKNTFQVLSRSASQPDECKIYATNKAVNPCTPVMNLHLNINLGRLNMNPLELPLVRHRVLGQSLTQGINRFCPQHEPRAFNVSFCSMRSCQSSVLSSARDLLGYTRACFQCSAMCDYTNQLANTSAQIVGNALI